MKAVVLFLFLSLSLTKSKAFAQDKNEITFISFELTHSLRIPNHHVVINIMNKNKQLSVHLVSTPSITTNNSYKKKDTVFAISVDDFEAVGNAVLKLNDINVDRAEADGFDGTVCKIKFGSADKTVTYEFWSPDFETEQRGLTNFLIACNKIIEVAHLKTKDVL